MDGEQSERGGGKREECSVHAESDLTLSWPAGEASDLNEAGDHSKK